eukprot:4705016-Pyramimonas_sp.AAC.1
MLGGTTTSPSMPTSRQRLPILQYRPSRGYDCGFAADRLAFTRGCFNTVTMQLVRSRRYVFEGSKVDQVLCGIVPTTGPTVAAPVRPFFHPSIDA